MRIPTLLSVVFLAAACSSSPDPGDDIPPEQGELFPPDVDLEVEPDRVDAGESVQLTLVNESAERIGYNLCASDLERWTSGDWLTAPRDQACTMELHIIGGNQAVSYTFELPEDIEQGEYRVSTTVEVIDSGARESILSDRFRVD